MIDEKKLMEELIPLLNEHGDMYFAGRVVGLIDSQPKICMNEKEICTDLRCPNREQNRS